MKTYDVIIYLGINQSHLHKYFNLRNELGKNFKTLLIIDYTRWGLTGNRLESSEYIYKLYKEHFDNHDVILCKNLKEAVNIIAGTPHKLGIYGASASRRKGMFMGSGCDIDASKAQGAKTIQISWTTGELAYKNNAYKGSDYVSLISKEIYNLLTDNHRDVDRYNSFVNKQKILYSNCLIYDPIENFIPNILSKESFYQKYSLDDKKPVFIYTPASVPSLKNKKGGGFGLQSYERVIKDLPEISNVFIKLHPSDLRLWKSDRIQNKYSFQLINEYEKHINNVNFLLPSDTHWGYKYCNAVLACQSTISWDVSQYKKPTIYLDINNKNNVAFNNQDWKNYFWPGMKSIESKNLREFFSNPASYNVKEEIFDKFNKKYFLNEHSYMILSDQVKDILG
jgi:hypothetical protein